jgi:hypothetical protein
MSLRYLDHVRLWRSTALVGIALGAAACSTTTVASRPQPPGVAEMQASEAPATFSFPAPAGTHYVWIERRRFDAGVAGTDVADRDQSELAWDVSMHPSALDTIVVDQRLVRVTSDHNGHTVVSGAPHADVQLVIDSGGTLEDVRGLDEASRAVRSMAAPGMEAWADRMFSPEALRTHVVTRHQLFFGDIVGRPTREGSTWIVSRRPESNALLRRYTVEGSEPCDASPAGAPTTCSRLRVRVDVDPSVATGLAGSLVERYVRSKGGQPSALSMRSAGYGLRGTLLVQPATMLSAGATLREAGRVSFASGDKHYDVDLRAVTEDRYEYGPRPVSQLH